MKRNPISAEQNIWFDGQQVDNTDLTLEQNYNDTVTSGIISDHIGTGVIPEVLTQRVLFDSATFVGLLDGIAVSTQNQPSDNNFGNQLEIELTHSKVTITKTIKICVIGLDFQSNLQYETFYFKTNDVQVSKKHFTQILVLLFNDFIGDTSLSFNLGGHVVIREAKAMTLSADPIMVAQDIEPNLFFRDFFVNGGGTLSTLLASALPFYNIDSLNIFTTVKDNKVLFINDVTTQVGQKFIATTGNIQKVSLLLSVRNQELGNETDLAWTGDLVISIYPLQSSIECPTDIAPNLQIDFAPSNIPVSQITVNYNTLRDSGVLLDSVPQPIDFVLSNSPVANNNALVVGNYYAITIKRAGSANKCDILIGVGNNRLNDSRVTTFTGTLWVDIPEDDLWFRIWTDAAKLSDGQAYESGHGITIPKTIEDPTSLVTVDYSLDNLQFFGNDSFYAVVSAQTVESTPVPDQRTGNPVLSRKEFEPQVSLLNTLDFTNLSNSIDPFAVGVITDKNKKFIDSLTNTITANLYSASLIKDELVIKIVDDPTDPKRYDSSVVSLVTALLNGNMASAKFTPNTNNPSVFYRLGAARLCSMIAGDVNGDGIVDAADLDLLSSYVSFNLNSSLPANTTVVTDGYNTTYTNGYSTYTNSYSTATAIHFQIVNTGGQVKFDGYAGVLVPNPNDPRLAQFASTEVTFNSIAGIGDMKVIILSNGNAGNYGGFDIVAVDTTNNVLSIRKVLLNVDVMEQLFRADIDGDFAVTANDQFLLRSYIDRLTIDPSPTPPYPAPTTNGYDKIGTTFNIIRIKLEQFIDRLDDYSPVVSGRSTTVHPAPDVFLADGYFAGHDYYNFPAPMSIQKPLTWDESLIVYTSDARLVPTIFNTPASARTNCEVEGVTCNVFPAKPDFEADKIDFFAPNNLILGGAVTTINGDLFKMDFEVGTIVLEIPDGYGVFNPEKTINIFSDFIFDYTGSGVTRLGFPAMRFADCSFVKSDALANHQVRFSVAVQSFSPNSNGIDEDGYSGVIVDGKIGVYIDYGTGLLTLNFANIFKDPTLRTLNTKIQISVFLKKAGFLNNPLVINPLQLQNLLNI